MNDSPIPPNDPYLEALATHGLFSNWLDNNGWDHALKLQRDKINKEISEMRADTPPLYTANDKTLCYQVPILIPADLVDVVLGAQAHWDDHQCAEAMAILASVTRTITEMLIATIEQEKGNN